VAVPPERPTVVGSRIGRVGAHGRHGGGYSCPAFSLVARIGVLFQFRTEDLSERAASRCEEITSSPLKAAPNGLEPHDPRGASAEALVGSPMRGSGHREGSPQAGRRGAGTGVDDGRSFTGRQGDRVKARRRDRPRLEGKRGCVKTRQDRSKAPCARLAPAPRRQRVSFLHLGVAKMSIFVGLGTLAT